MKNPMEEIRAVQTDGERKLHQFAELFEKHSADAMALAYSKLWNRADAEEVVQEAFLDAYRTLPKLRDPQKFGGWVRSIVLNRCVDALRSKTRREKLYREAAMTRDYATPVADLKEERIQQVTQAITELTDTYREPLTLRHIRGFSYEQISKTLSLPLDTVRTRISRGDAMLKDKLQKLIRKGEFE